EQLTVSGRQAGEDEVSGLARHWARLDAGRLLTSRALQRLQDREPDIAEASLAKWHNSDTAQKIAWWSLERLGLPVAAGGPPSSPTEVLEAAYREAAGMTISGGASEVLLEIVA
ncbi:acyl-CoA dehydrogenase family protein, partial [Streptomyces kebangsaanensis]|uniref:acyl-CoA dehydrogenase family protein n=1 Tax=Streptomyces kebangsaanensis TaxID=864058 RepID=UPI001F2209B8